MSLSEDPIFKAARRLYGNKALKALKRMLIARKLSEIPLEIREAMIEYARRLYEYCEETYRIPIMEASDWKVLRGEAKQVKLTKEDIERILLEFYKGDRERVKKTVRIVEREFGIPYIVTEEDMLDYLKDYIKDTVRMLNC